jgi:hypothetical protein
MDWADFTQMTGLEFALSWLPQRFESPGGLRRSDGAQSSAGVSDFKRGG